MRFTAVFIASALSAVAVAQSTTASPTMSLDPAQSSIIACLDKCGEDDVACKARCNPVPNPSESQVIQLDKCVGDCDQGDGSDADSEAYAKCRADCITKYYYNTSEGTPQATGGAGGSGSNGSNDAKTTGTDTANGAGSTGDSNSDDDSNNSDDNSGSRTDSEESGSGTGTSGSSQETESDTPDAASQLVGSGVAFFALAAAVFAL